MFKAPCVGVQALEIWEPMLEQLCMGVTAKGLCDSMPDNQEVNVNA
jgi:hypothetical protein